MSKCWASASTTLPFPSSPHWTPTTTLAFTRGPLAAVVDRSPLGVAGFDMLHPFTSVVYFNLRKVTGGRKRKGPASESAGPEVSTTASVASNVAVQHFDKRLF